MRKGELRQKILDVECDDHDGLITLIDDIEAMAHEIVSALEISGIDDLEGIQEAYHTAKELADGLY